VAKDLVTKMLKTNPQERISLEEMLEHPWFQGNPSTKQVAPTQLEPQALLLSDPIKKENYQVVSKPSLSNKAEVAASETTRQSIVIQKKIQQAAA
jgi:serine/threonine protein kinase